MSVVTVIRLSYVASAVLFILGLKLLSRADTARRGNQISAIGMLLAVVVTLLTAGLSYQWIIVGLAVGSAVGLYGARTVEMTGMPQMVALLNGFGGIASLLVGWAEYVMHPRGEVFTSVAISLAVLIGGLTFSGSLVAYAKLAGRISGKPVLFGGQLAVNGALMLGAVACGVLFCMDGGDVILWVLIAVALVSGVMAVIPIGGADMPVVVALLNSYSGLAACAAGFGLLNEVLIVAGSLVGASGLILTSVMCKAMNRPLANVLFAGVGSGKSSGSKVEGEAKAISAEDAFYVLEAARSVVVVPGYGMAVAQAQHVVYELGGLLKANGAEVKYCIHPVAGRMPGHMNILLAEANVPYEELVEPKDVNSVMPTVDVGIVIGANDVVNPAARTDEECALYGMPIVDVDMAKTVFVLKRSLSAGFAGVGNPLFFGKNSRMLFGDAKKTVSALVSEFKAE